MLVDKPAGLTSHDVVQRVRRIVNIRAAGHTGTLDPFATGLLVVLVGRATRLARFVEAQPKTYLATARLGTATDTDDATGAAVGDPRPVSGHDRTTVGAALVEFEGTREQRPPAYSAKHIGGERSYRLARQGRAVELSPVTVTVHRIALVDYRAPDVVFRATVSPGTYLRAIARDLGERLNTGAHLTSLRREAIGELTLDDATALDALTPESVRPVRAVLGHLPVWELDETARIAVSHGRAVASDDATEGDVALMRGNELIAVGHAADGWIRPSVVLGTP
ncbi:MAG: tRNA pseudouridine(55) synthase TruB [Gemmatimonadales bacterium]